MASEHSRSPTTFANVTRGGCSCRAVEALAAGRQMLHNKPVHEVTPEPLMKPKNKEEKREEEEEDEEDSETEVSL